MSFERTLGDFWGTRLGEWSVVRRGELLLSEAGRPSLEGRTQGALERVRKVVQRAKRSIFE
jgi:hypothetical protein